MTDLIIKEQIRFITFGRTIYSNTFGLSNKVSVVENIPHDRICNKYDVSRVSECDFD
jgi:hypothetical protein